LALYKPLGIELEEPVYLDKFGEVDITLYKRLLDFSEKIVEKLKELYKSSILIEDLEGVKIEVSEEELEKTLKMVKREAEKRGLKIIVKDNIIFTEIGRGVVIPIGFTL